MSNSNRNTFPKSPKTLAARIRFLRGDRTQIEYADHLNRIRVRKAVPKSSVRQAMISRYESGKEIPSPWVMYRIAGEGGKPMEWVLAGETARL